MQKLVFFSMNKSAFLVITYWNTFQSRSQTKIFNCYLVWSRKSWILSPVQKTSIEIFISSRCLSRNLFLRKKRHFQACQFSPRVVNSPSINFYETQQVVAFPIFQLAIWYEGVHKNYGSQWTFSLKTSQKSSTTSQVSMCQLALQMVNSLLMNNLWFLTYWYFYQLQTTKGNNTQLFDVSVFFLISDTLSIKNPLLFSLVCFIWKLSVRTIR